MTKTTGVVLVVRHGKAEDHHPMGDYARALTDDGRHIFRAHAAMLAQGLGLRGIVTSPLVRAVQTAEILAAACGIDQVLVRRELDPDAASVSRLDALARELGPGWALVGHNPSLGDAVGAFLGTGDVSLKKGAVVALEPRRQGWSLAWSAVPGRPVATELV